MIATAVPSAALLWSHDMLAAGMLAAVAITTVPVGQMQMPAINRATDQGQRQRFKWLHGPSVVITPCSTSPRPGSHWCDWSDAAHRVCSQRRQGRRRERL